MGGVERLPDLTGLPPRRHEAVELAGRLIRVRWGPHDITLARPASSRESQNGEPGVHDVNRGSVRHPAAANSTAACGKLLGRQRATAAPPGPARQRAAPVLHGPGRLLLAPMIIAALAVSIARQGDPAGLLVKAAGRESKLPPARRNGALGQPGRLAAPKYGNSARARGLAGIGTPSPSAVLVMMLSCTSITSSAKPRPLNPA